MIKLTRLTLCLTAVMAVAGCTKINLENYESIEVGMEQQEIDQILGHADKCTETLGTKSCIWGSEEGKHIKVNFAADKAVIFSHQGLE